MSKGTVHAPAVPAILNDPLLNGGAAFTVAGREALRLAGRLPAVYHPTVALAP